MVVEKEAQELRQAVCVVLRGWYYKGIHRITKNRKGRMRKEKVENTGKGR